MTIALMVLTDGRWDYLDRTIASAERSLAGYITTRLIINDALGDELYKARLHESYGDRYDIRSYDHKLGFSGAIQAGWDALRASGKRIGYVFHLENDFTFNELIDLDAMAEVLDTVPDLAQLALVRQPWNEQEKAAGGIVQMRPENYEQTGQYTKHTVCFTTNPCLYRYDLTERGWPQESNSEGLFGIALREQGFHFGYWQTAPFDGPKVHHIGEHRVGTGY